MKRNALTIGIIILIFLSGSLPLSLGFNVNQSFIINDGNTLYVGGGGPGNYTSIQVAIDDALDGDTVFVYDDSSIYYENNIIISKSINLIGENKDTTIIDGGDADIFLIYDANNVTLSGFKIQNGRYGIRHGSSSYSLILGNLFINNRLDGILMSNSSYNTISDNIFQNNDYGISLDWTLSAPGPNLYNNIMNNTISNCSYRGIQLSTYQRYNYIIGNTIENNKKEGVMICCNSNYNVVYHNNFIANGVNAKDEFNNTWDDGYPSGGNFWDDYAGIDEDSDGIGDTPYNISGGDSMDRYPLMRPWGVNHPPDTPIINGPNSGKPGVNYNFSFVSTDPEDDDLYYLIDWDDGYEDVIGIYSSGTEAYASHAWAEKGSYNIRAKAVDTSGAESDLGEFTVTIPRNKSLNNPFLNILRSYPNIFQFLQRLIQI